MRALACIALGVLLACVPHTPARTSAQCGADAPVPDTAALRRMYAGPPSQWPRPCIRPGVAWTELAALPAQPPAPADNPTTPAKVALGRRLFEDPRLSRSGQIACASCHEPDEAFADGRRVSFGHDRAAGERNAPSVRYAAHAPLLFWDGRAGSLEDQAISPIEHPGEMAFSREGLAARLRGLDDYADAARATFGGDRLTVEDVTDALAAFQRSLAVPRGRFQAWLRGHARALPDPALRGLHLFRTRAGCMNCHHGPTFSDGRFHNLGLSFCGTRRQDLGRYVVSGDPADVGAFRTPLLLGVAQTAPYMHRGHFRDLRGVLTMYNAGVAARAPRTAQPDGPACPPPTALAPPLGLSEQDIADIEAFLETL